MVNRGRAIWIINKRIIHPILKPALVGNLCSLRGGMEVTPFLSQILKPDNMQGRSLYYIARSSHRH